MDRQGGNIVFECDTCSESVLDTGTGDFDSARNLMRREQWTVRKVGSDWLHFCSECKSKAA